MTYYIYCQFIHNNNKIDFIETLEKLSIPSYDTTTTKTIPRNQNNIASSLPRLVESGDVVDAVMNSPPIVQVEYNKASPAINAHNQIEAESNSEDSSLSDGDRTLVGDVSPMLSASNSPACSEQHLSSPEEHHKANGDTYGDDDTDMLHLGNVWMNIYVRICIRIYYRQNWMEYDLSN